MWDWNIVSGEIYVGDSIAEVFGYKIKNNTINYEDFKNCLVKNEINKVEKKLWKTLAAGNKSWNDSFLFKHFDGSIATVISRASIVRDDKGKAVRLIGAIQDVSKLHNLEVKLQNTLASMALMMQGIRVQKNIESAKDKLVAQNILLALAKQIDIDVENKKIVAENILIALSKQIAIDAKNKKIVARNIALAVSQQKVIDIKKEKQVASNIILAIKKQKQIDIKKEKTVTDNIALAIADQKNIDAGKEKIVADNILAAISHQIEIDARNKKSVAENIVLAIAKQIKIDALNKKIVEDNIALAITKQKNIDALKEKVVAANIISAIAKQEEINLKSEKKVARDIVLAQTLSDGRLAKNNEKFLLASRLSSDVIWDWNLQTNNLYLGEGFEELFGYCIQNHKANLTDWSNYLHPDDKEEVEKAIYHAIATTATNWEHNYRFIRADGSIANVYDRASIMRHPDGKAYRMIGAMQDCSRLKELEEKLGDEIANKSNVFAEYDKKFNLLFNSSSDVLYDSDLLTNTVYISDAYEKEFGYKITANMSPAADWVSHIHPEDRANVFEDYSRMLASDDMEWKYSYRLLRSDGSVANVFSSAVVFRDTKGTAVRMVGSMVDNTKQSRLEEKLKQEFAFKGDDIKNFRQLFHSSPDVLLDIDVIKNKVQFSDSYEKVFGYKLKPDMSPEKDWAIHIHPDDKKRVLKSYLKGKKLQDTEWDYSYRFIKANGSVVHVLSTGIILRNDTGKIIRMLGVMRDISKESQLEERLQLEIDLKEKQIAEAAEDAKNTERSDIGKELHDNVNQLLGASRMYLEIAKLGGENSEKYIRQSSQYTLAAIEEIRKLTKGLTTDVIKNLGLCEAIENIVTDTMEVHSIKITCSLESFLEKNVNEKFKLNIYRILQEQLNNILKHARASEVHIGLVHTHKTILLSITDNGVGFDTGKKKEGIGLSNIKSRAEVYHGEVEFISQLGEGCVLRVIFPIADALLNKRLN